MEGTEMPMTSGVVISAAQPESFYQPEVAKVLDITRRQVNNDVDASIFDANLILDSAKNEGFEQTLFDLAEGKFDDQSIEEELQYQEEESVDEVKDLIIDDEMSQEVKEQPIVAEGNAELLNQKMEQLDSRFKGIEEDYMSKREFLEVLSLFAEYKKAKTEKEKMSVLEILVKMMTFILAELASPEDSNYKGLPSAGRAGQTSESHEPIDMEEFKKVLLRKGLSKQSPIVENQAA